MTAFRRLPEINPMELFWPLAIFAVSLAAGYLVRSLGLRAVRAWAKRARSRAGTLIGEALIGPSAIWVVILAAHLALEGSDLPEHFTFWSGRILLVLWVVSLTLMGMRIAGDLVRHLGGQMPGALPVTTLTQNLAKLGVLVLGLVLVLQSLGARITPILTALGVGGLAVALALQDTLSNLFGGFYVAVSGHVRLEDYIRLNTGEEGYVADIGWRSTTLRGLANNLVIVPNAKLSQAIVTNFHLPEKRMASSVQVSVSYASDPDQVETLLLDVAVAASREVPGMLAEPEPSVAFDPGFGDFALGFTVNYSVTEFVSQFGVKNELRKRIFRRFKQEGVEIPFPTRTVYTAPESQAPGHARAGDSETGV